MRKPKTADHGNYEKGGGENSYGSTCEWPNCYSIAGKEFESGKKYCLTHYKNVLYNRSTLPEVWAELQKQGRV